MIINLISVSLIISFVLLALVFLFISLIYKKKEKKILKITNTFIFEVMPSFKSKESILNYVLLFSLLLVIFPFIFYGSTRFNSYIMTMVVISTLAAFCLASLPFISLAKLKEHLYLSIGALVSVFALLASEGYYLINLFRLYDDIFYLIGGIVAFSLSLIILIMIFNPKLFVLKNDLDESGNPIRKKFIPLAFSEWMLYIFYILSLVPLLISCL